MNEEIQKKERELLEELGDTLEDTDTYYRGDTLEIPAWDVSVQLEIEQLTDQSAVLNYYLDSPGWDRRLFECCAGIGKDQQQAIGMAQGSFLFGMLDGVRAMAQEGRTSQLESDFAGIHHQWDVYQSNLVGMGEMPKDTSATDIWELIREGVRKRIGGQKICYVKVYCAKNGGDITGECRINDVPILELSDVMSDYARKWKTKSFGSQKQFFFLLQREETYVPYPYAEEDIADAVHTALKLYGKNFTCGEDNQQYLALLEEEVKDASLAEELCNFLPEMCAENAFPAVQSGEMVGIFQGKDQASVYKTQLASYYFIYNALMEELRHDFPNELFGFLVSASSMYNAVRGASEKGADLAKDGGRIFISYGFSDNYRLR